MSERRHVVWCNQPNAGVRWAYHVDDDELETLNGIRARTRVAKLHPDPNSPEGLWLEDQRRMMLSDPTR